MSNAREPNKQKHKNILLGKLIARSIAEAKKDKYNSKGTRCKTGDRLSNEI